MFYMIFLLWLFFCLPVFYFLFMYGVTNSLSTNVGVTKKRERILGSTFTVLQVNIGTTILM